MGAACQVGISERGLLAQCLLENHLNSVNLSFLICKVGKIIMATPKIIVIR